MYSIKLYLNTGFNSLNIPSDPNLLNEFNEFFEFDNIDIIQNLYLAYVVLSISFENATKVDYIEISNNENDKKYFYTVEEIEMRSQNVCKFKLLIDPYNSIGGLINNNKIISCSANRCHVKQKYTDSGAFDERIFNLPEPFKCNEALIFNSAYFKMGEADTYDDLSIVEMVVFPPTADAETNRDPLPSAGIQRMSPSNATPIGGALEMGTTIGKYANQISIPDGSVEMIDYIVNSSQVLKCIKPNSSLIKLNIGNQTLIIDGLIYSLRDLRNETINDYITVLRAMGAETGIIGAYIVPSIWAEAVNFSGNVDPKSQTQINNKFYQSLPSSPIGTIKINGSFTAKKIINPKTVNTSGINKMIVYSSASGSFIELDPSNFETRDSEAINYEVSEQQYICNANNQVSKIIQPYFVAYSDPRRDGTPILKILNRYQNTFTSGINGDVADGAFTVKGANWQNSPILYEGMSGYIQAQKQQNSNNKKAIDQNLGGLIMGAAATLGGAALVATGVGAAVGGVMISGGAATLVSAGSSFIMNSREHKRQEALLNQNSEFTYSPINIETNNTIRDLSRNTFRIGWYCMQQFDLLEYDKFLNKYGYNVGNFEIDKTYFNNREAFNFIRLNDIHIESDEPLYLLKLVEEQLQSGVRLWHKKPSSEFYEPEKNLCIGA